VIGESRPLPSTHHHKVILSVIKLVRKNKVNHEILFYKLVSQDERSLVKMSGTSDSSWHSATWSYLRYETMLVLCICRTLFDRKLTISTRKNVDKGLHRLCSETIMRPSLMKTATTVDGTAPLFTRKEKTSFKM
jgi:hypothetical protein